MSNLTHVDFGFSCEWEIRIFRKQCQTISTKNVNISLRKCFLKLPLRPSFFAQNFDEETCNTMHRF